MRSTPIALLLMMSATRVASPQDPYDLNGKALEECRLQHPDEADRLYTEAAAVWSSAGEQFLPHLATTLANQGKCRLENNRWKAAEEIYQKALDLSRQSLGSESLLTAVLEGRVGARLASNGHLSEAEADLAHAVAFLRSADPASHEYAQALVDLAFVYSRQGKFAEADDSAQRASVLIERRGEPESIEMALLCANVASLHVERGHPERAEPLYRKARLVLERLAGPNDPRLASVLAQEGRLLLDSKKLGLAEVQLTRAVEILRASRGENTPDFAVAEANLAELRMASNQRDQAVHLLEHAIEVHRATHDGPSPELVAMEKNLQTWRSKKRH